MEYFDESTLMFQGDIETYAQTIQGAEMHQEFGDREMGSNNLIDIFAYFLLGDDECNRKIQVQGGKSGKTYIEADGFRLILPSLFAVSIIHDL